MVCSPALDAHVSAQVGVAVFVGDAGEEAKGACCYGWKQQQYYRITCDFDVFSCLKLTLLSFASTPDNNPNKSSQSTQEHRSDPIHYDLDIEGIDASHIHLLVKTVE